MRNRYLGRIFWQLVVVLNCGVLWSCNAHAHLLNMSRVQITVLDNGQIQADFEVDLSREIGGNQRYFELSQNTQAQLRPKMKTILARLIDSSKLRYDGQILPWSVLQVDLPDKPKEDFFSGLAWPMTHIRLHSQLPAESINSGHLIVTFSDPFLFEEPIALTFLQPATGRKMSRWLVPNQQSPVFALYVSDSETDINQHDVWQWQLWFDYIYLGMKHIIPLGLDHVLFVLGLFLGARNGRQLLWLITGFTLAHSVTLALSSYGAIAVPASIVEPLIAFSIFWVAIENMLFQRAGRWRIITVFMFGLLHGLGFAQALRELGLPTDSFIASLISFNVGVELAQLLVVLAAYALVGWARSKVIWRYWVVFPASTGIALVALYWTISRLSA